MASKVSIMLMLVAIIFASLQQGTPFTAIQLAAYMTRAPISPCLTSSAP